MAQSKVMRLRALWFQVHKWIGISLALLIVPISISGAALVWHDALDAAVNPGRYAVSGAEASLPPSAYAEAAQRALGAEGRVMSLRYSEEGAPVVATAVRAAQGEGGRPARTSVWLDPPTARVLDKAPSEAGLVRFLHGLHGSLTIPGMGRQIVGWVGVFMFVSCLTGIWLWWPLAGSFRRGFRWKRQNSTNANIHHQIGFWILLPLAMLSFTGFWISFPAVFGNFEAAQPRAKSGGGAPPDRARQARAQPLARTAMTADAALAAARPAATGALASLAWPTDLDPKWKLGFAGAGGPAEVAVDDASGKVTPPRPPRPETNARLMRRLHDGTQMGALWQAIIFLGGIIPAMLAITGLVMWWRSRGWKAALAKKRKDRGRLAPQPAE